MFELIQIGLKTNNNSSGSLIWDFFKDFVVPITIAVIATWGAFKIFVLESRRDNEKAQKDKENERIDKLLYFSALVKSCIDTATKQNEFLQEYMNKIDEDPINLKPLPKVVWQDLQRVSQKIELEDYLIAYTGYYKTDKNIIINEFKTIVGSIDLFFEIFSELPHIVSRTITHSYTKKIDIQKYQQLIFTLLNNFTFHLFNTDRVKYGEFNSVMKSFQEKNKDEKIKYSLNYFYTDFFIPLYDFTNSYLSTVRNNTSHAEEIHQYAKMGKEIYEVLKDEAIEFKQIIKTDHDKVEEYIIKIKENSKHLLNDFI